jgi:transposase-like protein
VSDPLYRDRAELYAPKTPAEVARAARDLAASGYSDHTIAAILKVDTNYLRQMIGERAA